MSKQVVHIPPADPTSGDNVELRDRQARRFHERGYSVQPVPADEHEHRYLTVCNWCTEEQS